MSSWNPSEKYQKLLSLADDLLQDERRTVRDVYYALEARGHDYDYRQVKRALKKGRRAGFLDPSMIVDSSRPPSFIPDDGYGGLEEFYDRHLDGVAEAYWEDWWSEQPEYIEIWLEKQSLESVFRPITEEFNVRLECTRGDWSDSKVVRAKDRLMDKREAGKDVTVLYFGDYNPSGFHAPVSIQNTLQEYGMSLSRRHVGHEHRHYFDISPHGRLASPSAGVGSILFKRIAINTDHVQEFDLPPNPNPSSTDKDRKVRDSFMEHVTAGGPAEGDVNIELNALKEYQREFLEDLIRSSIEEHIDGDAREEVHDRIRERREWIEEAVDIDRDAFLEGAS